VTDGFTITFFLVSNAQPGQSGAVYVGASQSGCSAAQQVFSPQQVILNGMTGYAFNFTQADIAVLVNFINTYDPGCNVASKDLKITAVVAIPSPGQFTTTLDAAATGFGQNAYPGTLIQ
jgi:hypothetical protein